MQGRKSSTSRAASVHQIGTGDDLVLNYMAKHGIPMTHQNWLEISYPDGVPEWSAELESEVPKIFQLKD